MSASLTRYVLLLLAASLFVGCSTQRTLMIDSTPTCARVWVNGEAKGYTPVKVPFIYYATFEVRLEKPGYEALAEEVVVPTKIDGYPIVDLPFEMIVRRRAFSWRGKMKPLSQPTDEALKALLRDAEAFREKTLREARLTTPPARPSSTPSRRSPSSPSPPCIPPPPPPPPPPPTQRIIAR